MNKSQLEKCFLVGNECLVASTDIYTLLKVEGKNYSVYLGRGELKAKIRDYTLLYDARQFISVCHRSPKFTKILFEEYIKGN